MSQPPCNSESFRESDIIGKANVVEFHRMDDGTWMPFPAEYKCGKPMMDDCDKVQLCAQDNTS
jgi:hypothetical protein